MHLFGVTATLALLVAVTTAFPNGARVPPQKQMNSMCTTGNLRPFHADKRSGQLLMPSMLPSPNAFTLTATGPNPYGPGSVFTVTLRAAPGKSFKGFFISADAEDAKFGVRGSFSADGPNRNKAKNTNFCTPGMTHTNNNPKNQVTVKYTAPANFTHGTLQFKATVVENYSTFYVGILSQPINAQRGGGVKTETQQQMAVLQGGMRGMGGMMSSLLGGMDISGMMQKLAGGMGRGGGPQMNRQGNPLAMAMQG